MSEARRRQWEREAQARALQTLGLELGDRVWYWHRAQGDPPRWVVGTVAGAGGKDGGPVVDVRLEDPTLLAPYQGFVKWGYGWQVRPWGEDPPPPPTPEEMYP